MNLKTVDILILSCFPVLMATGQLLFRLCSSRHMGVPILNLPSLLFCNPIFYIALVLYGSATIIWLWLLTRYPLATAYPFAALAIALVPILEVLFFRANLSAGYWLGLGLMISGIIILVKS